MSGSKAASQLPRENFSEEVRGEPGYIGVWQQRAGSQTVKRLLLIKENQISQGFNACLNMGRC